MRLEHDHSYTTTIAATEIDDLMRGEKTNLDSVYEVARFLKEGVKNYQHNKHWDPVVFNVFLETNREDILREEQKGVFWEDNLVYRAALAAQELSNIQHTSQKRRKELLDFTLKLSEQFRIYDSQSARRCLAA